MSSSDPDNLGLTSGSSPYSRDRLLALSDGVFAIAITLLALELVPHITKEMTGSDLVNALLDSWPELVAYLLSFLVIGSFWDNHRRYFEFIHRADTRVVRTNLLVLLWVTMIPASAALLGSHWFEPLVITIYAVNLLLVNVSFWVLWRYVSSADHVEREKLHIQTDSYIDRYVIAGIIGYALCIPVAFASPQLSLLLVFLTASFARVVARQVLRLSGSTG